MTIFWVCRTLETAIRTASKIVWLQSREHEMTRDRQTNTPLCLPLLRKQNGELDYNCAVLTCQFRRWSQIPGYCRRGRGLVPNSPTRSFLSELTTASTFSSFKERSSHSGTCLLSAKCGCLCLAYDDLLRCVVCSVRGTDINCATPSHGRQRDNVKSLVSQGVFRTPETIPAKTVDGLEIENTPLSSCCFASP